jgi:hypothetical protein
MTLPNMGKNKIGLEINWEDVALGKKLIGQKALLTGGGMLMNELYIVKIKGVNEETGQVICFDGKETREPYMYSWKISELPDELKSLKEGKYLYGTNFDGDMEFRDSSKCGIFGTVYDCPVVKTLKPIKRK